MSIKSIEEINAKIRSGTVAVNLSDKPIYTYMGLLKPNLGNANYCSAGQLSPLLKDPFIGPSA